MINDKIDSFVIVLRCVHSLDYDAATNVYSTWQVALFRNIYSQLLRSPQRTFDPEEASTFFIPYDAGVETYIYRDGTFRGGGNPLAKVISKYLSASDIFKRRGGADHFMVYSISLLSQGVGGKLRRLFKLCKNTTILTFETNRTYSSRSLTGISLPYLQAIPYPSVYHWKDSIGKPSIPVLDENQGHKLYLIAYVASTETNQPDANKFRRLLHKQCIQANDNYLLGKFPPTISKYKKPCWNYDIGSQVSRNNFDAKDITGIYKNSVFCFMPPGDTKTRRAIFDSLLSGCIPVLFEYPGTSSPINPMSQYSWHYTEEEIKMVTYFFDGSRTDYINQLIRIPQEELSLRLTYVKKVAFRSQYSIPNGACQRNIPMVSNRTITSWAPPSDDGVSVILQSMKRKVKKI